MKHLLHWFTESLVAAMPQNNFSTFKAMAPVINFASYRDTDSQDIARDAMAHVDTNSMEAGASKTDKLF